MTWLECLQEAVDNLRAALPDGTDLEAWLAEADVAEIDGAVEDAQAIAFNVGYLRGAHEALDITMLEMLQEFGVRLTAKNKRKRFRVGTKPRPRR